MKAFFVISTHLGGAERSLLDFLKEYKKDQQDFIVVTPKNHGPLIEEFEKNGIPWQCLPLPKWFLGLSRKKILDFFIKTPLAALYLPRLYKKLNQYIKENQVARVHSTGLKYHLLLGFYSLTNKELKLIIHLRDLATHPALQKLFAIIATNPRVKWVSNSKATADSIQPIESEVIYNGFPTMEPPTTKTSLREKLQLPENIPLIGVVGAIARWKGQREFIAMAHTLIKQNLPYHFVIVGSEIYDTGGEQGELTFLKNQVQQLSIGDRIHFLEFQTDVQSVYRSLDLLVHASIEPEPFGRVLVEAMSEGLPVTASRAGGPLEIIEPNKNGLLHEPGNIESMSENVQYLLSHPEETRTMAKNAQERSKFFSIAQHVEQLKTALESF